MIDRLAIVKQRFDEVSDLIIQPDIIADQKRYVALNREYKDLSALMEKRTAYLNLTQRQQEAEEIISDGSEPEMTDMAKEELEEVKSKLLELEETIRFMLIPKDPEDTKISLWNSVRVQVGMRRRFLLETCIECIPNTAKARGGK